MNKYKYLIFDFNGTIINDVDLCLELLNRMLKEKGHQEVSLDRYKRIFTFPIKDYYELAGFDFTKESFADLAIEYIKSYQPMSLNCQLYDYAVETFEYLIAQGYKLIVLSASEQKNLLEQMNNFKITKYFDTVLGLDNIHAVSKVDRGLEYLKENQIASKDVMMVGDTLHDKEVALTLGIDFMLVTTGHQHEDVLRGENNKLIKSIKDLIKIL